MSPKYIRYATTALRAANEKLKRRYLEHVRTIAEQYLDWDYLGAKVASARQLIASEVMADTRKLMTDEAFQQAVDNEKGSLREFCDKRRKYPLNLPAIKQLSSK